MIRRFLVLFAVCFVFIFSGVGIFASVSGDSESRDVLVSASLLDHAGLRMAWQVNLPTKQSEKVGRIYVFGEYLYVLTDQNYLFCVNREKGTVRFGLQLAAAGLPVFEPQYYDGRLLFMVGNRFLVLDPVIGAVTEPKRLDVIGRSAIGAVARNASHIFIVGTDKRLHAIVPDGYWQKFKVTANNDSSINSVVADDRFVIFSTVAGNIVSISPQEPERLWQFDISGSIVAPIVRDGRWLYVSGLDTKLYKINISNGTSGWAVPFHAGAALRSSAWIGERIVYQYAGENGLYAVDKKSGKVLWQVVGGVAPLGEIGSTTYVFAEPGVLIAMNNAAGERLYSVNFAAVSKYATGAIGSIMYVADDNGRVASIELKTQQR